MARLPPIAMLQGCGSGVRRAKRGDSLERGALQFFFPSFFFSVLLNVFQVCFLFYYLTCGKEYVTMYCCVGKYPQPQLISFPPLFFISSKQRR